MKILLWILSFILFYNNAYATECFFSGYEKKNNSVYGITECDDKHLDIIPFADYNSFEIDEEIPQLASDYNYSYSHNRVISKTDGGNFVELNKYIFTDRKNIFIKSQEGYLFISKYKFDTKIFTIYETDNGGRYILSVNGEIFNINISGGYISYNGDIYKITNILDLDNLKQITPYIFTDGTNFYSTFLKNQSKQNMNFGYDLLSANLFSSNKKEFFKINEMGHKLIKNNYSEESRNNILLIYSKLKLTKNPYINKNEDVKYGEFFIKKELLLHYLGIIINK